MDVKNNVICLTLTIIMAVSYMAMKRCLRGRIEQNITSILWAVPFMIYGFAARRTAWIPPNMEHTEYIPYAIAAIAFTLVQVLYCSGIDKKDLPPSLYQLLIRPTLLECVLSGILMPALFMVPALAYWLNFSFLYINGAVVVVSLLQIFLSWWEDREHVLSVLEYILQFAVCAFHALIIVFTGSIVIPLILRILYSILAWRKGKGHGV